MGLGNNYSGIGPERGKAFIFYIGLVSQADTKVLKANPTLAAGDFKVSIDGAGFNNLGTLPTVTPASGTAVKITLSAAEMEGDNIIVTAIDAGGAEWCDQLIDIQTGTGAAQAVELAEIDTTGFTPTTSEFETDSITEATASHYVGRACIFTSGNLRLQACTIKAYSLSGGRGHFTVSTMTEAPANNDRFVIV